MQRGTRWLSTRIERGGCHAVRGWLLVAAHRHVLGSGDRGLRMSEYTREEILKLIEENEGSEGRIFVAGNRIRRS